MLQLPVETLLHVIYFIASDDDDALRQWTLVALTHTNRLFNVLARPALLERPILKTQPDVENWGRYYSRLLDPWRLCNPTKRLNHIPAPTQITFFNYRHRSICRWDQHQPSFPGYCGSPYLYPLLETTSYLFRNLTTIEIAPSSYFDDNFVAKLLAPKAFNRSTITKLCLNGSLYKQAWVVRFVFDGSPYVMRVLGRYDFNRMPPRPGFQEQACFDSIPASEDYERRKLNWRKITVNNGTLKRIAQEAQFNYGALLAIAEPVRELEQLEHLTLQWDNVHDLIPSHFPFSALRTLEIELSSNSELYLIFFRSLFPNLRDLTLSGYWKYGRDYLGQEGWDELLQFKVWRRSITTRSGSIEPPATNEFPVPEWPPYWRKLSPRQLDEYPSFLLPYQGPDLDVLNLSDFHVDKV